MTMPQFRKSRTTPCDRPPTALRNSSLLSKLVMDPLKNLASSAAHRLFASVTCQRHMPPPAPPLPPESSKEYGDGPGETVLKNQAEAPAPLAVDGQNLTSADTGGIFELEQLLKRKTLTRSEIDHLIELLQSKAADLTVDSEVKRAEANLSEPTVNLEKQQQLLKSPLAENGIEKEKCHSVISNPGVSAKVLQEDVASPAELAKAYKGSQPSKVSPSMWGWRSQAIREEAALLSNVSFTPKSHGNNDQMSMQDSMAEDVQSTNRVVPVFGQQPISPSPAGFAFGSTAVPQSASPFQFGGQQSQVTLQNSSPFQASGSVEFNAGGSFALCSGREKSGRRILKVNGTKLWKK